MSDDLSCVYCGADCDAPEPDHMLDCPQATGVYPVRREAMRPCPHCAKPTLTMQCASCEAALEPGDKFCRVQVLDDGIASGDTVSLCIGCAVLNEGWTA